MAVRPRSIGSTIKPFIYFKGFEKGLRPYTRVEDREYKYIIDSGFAFYPKNYDYEYRGEVDLHYALANSLNVPTVKVLEYFGLEDFYSFLSDDLSFTPVQPLPNYQLGIALGELEMDLLSLSYYFSILANSGYLQPLEICQSGDCSFPVLANLDVDKKIVDEKYIQLVNKILSDRQTGVEQFGIRSDLNLLFGNYAVKTGTSREFHDSWTIGYTPDFIVGVWVGNSDERPMNNVSGSAGAGRIWQEAMNLLYNSEHNHRNSFDFSKIKEFSIDGNLVFGLLEDDFTDAYSKLLGNNLMLEPHDGDVFLLEKNTQILLKARSTVSWLINGAPLAGGEEAIFYPQVAGRYEIKAVSPNGVEEIISIIINETE
jgi:membrane carboxypeptidase/penicillin-binding protein PbpC